MADYNTSKDSLAAEHEQLKHDYNSLIAYYLGNQEMRLVVLDLLERSLAQSRIDALAAELAALKAENAWHPISLFGDALPEFGRRVLIYDSFNENVEVGKLTKLGDNRYQWEANNCYYLFDNYWQRITHWRELPAPPGKSEKE